MDRTEEMKNQIRRLKAEKDAVILAHFYQRPEVQEVADFVGDSFELAKRAKTTSHKIIVLCGVKFMAESAKLLNPEKKVLLPASDAGCPMADMVTPQDVDELRGKYPDAAVVCYVNSSAAVKAKSDICCTSSSAERVVRSLPNKQIIFIPDKNLGAYVASKVPEKEIILFNGFCPIHNNVSITDIAAAKQARPEAELLLHPECRAEVLVLADFVGSTAQLIDYVKNSPRKEFIIGTEEGVVHRMNTLFPDKKCYLLTPRLLCSNMKKTSLEAVLDALENERTEITLSDAEFKAAAESLNRMVTV